MEQEYVELVYKLIGNFEKSLSEDEEKEKLIEAFKRHMEAALNYIKSSNLIAIEDSKSVKKFLEQSANEICNMDIISIKQRLLEDKSFKEIRIISGDVFELAKRKKMGENIEIDFDISDKIRQLAQILKKVEPYNIMQAKELISEAVLDLKYVCEDEKKVSSLRLYHFMNNQRRDKGEDEGR